MWKLKGWKLRKGGVRVWESGFQLKVVLLGESGGGDNMFEVQSVINGGRDKGYGLHVAG